MQKLHHIISTKGDLYLTDEEYKEFFSSDSTDYFHTGSYQREVDGSIDLDKKCWDRTQSLISEGTIDFGTGLKY